MVNARRYRVLLAEDDLICQQIVCVLLSDALNVDIHIRDDGRGALEAALNETFDLLIVDQNLPQISGDRLVKHLRVAKTRNAKTPILRYSAHYTQPCVRNRLLGSDVLVPKPIDGGLLVDTVRALLVGESVDLKKFIRL